MGSCSHVLSKQAIWYQSLFGQPETPPGHDDFGQMLDTDGTVLLCLHQWGAHEHPSSMSPDAAPAPARRCWRRSPSSPTRWSWTSARRAGTRGEGRRRTVDGGRWRSYRPPSNSWIVLDMGSTIAPTEEARLRYLRASSGRYTLLPPAPSVTTFETPPPGPGLNSVTAAPALSTRSALRTVTRACVPLPVAA